MWEDPIVAEVHRAREQLANDEPEPSTVRPDHIATHRRST